MLVISPRSYVTAAFDLLFPTLLEHVFDKLKSNSSWWADVVYAQKGDIFKGNSYIRKKVRYDNVPEIYHELFDYFDEYSLCQLVLSFEARKYFNNDDLNNFRELLKIKK